MSSASTTFTMPPELSAAEPPEARGLDRDEVRLLVARERSPVRHTTFRALPSVLRRGDLVVVNTSDTEPAAVDGHRADGRPVTVHVSGPAPDQLHVVELRTPDGQRVADGVAGEGIALPCGVVATLLTGHPDPRVATGSRLWRARIPVAGGLRAWLAEAGRPIRYSYVDRRWPIDAYRTVFARSDGEFGSAEMPSAGRPFTSGILNALHARGVGVARIVLHTGVSSLEAGEVPLPERYRVPPETADAVNAVRAAGGRVVAVGTTTTRALETAAAPDGFVTASDGWTHLVLGPDRPARVVDGLVTGWHEPQASHLLLLEAVAGARLVSRAYAAALEHRYRWHEFGDSCLLLPAQSVRRSG
ncbi:S-adenosylmethionine:tRNA ribosyltransferase-isomerase [Pseudonocardia cypriaca]|uniref:S-adenosylmethionine:tRNA ribosyltransferase-isomerase n=1 Tax=Pseudonocardia cypriaca TaxID=882449 RepID=A0A543FXQ4_9PSEU|nr:S-adenosylmethionine:tRNA ribosyltransferase-isomerase [Pseudonocardia cypriaca]TQM38559.1 S-adenosylmethionine:tRNA ribosyltransferase-isomerase [Pseudonocardia cypriaca]